MYCLLRALVSIALMYGMVSAQTSATRLHNAINKLSLTALEKRAGEIQSELSRLSHFAPRGGIGTIGYRSEEFTTPDRQEWVQIELAENTAIDQIILVPCLVRTPQGGYRADGFPESFKITDEDGKILAEFSTTADDHPRISPVVIELNGQSASQIRIDATRLSARAFDQKFTFKLSEVLVFSGQKNVALRCSVTSSRMIPDNSHVYHPAFLTDGAVPYLMNTAQGKTSVAYLSPHHLSPDKLLNFTIDLEKSTPISGIHLHTVEQSDNVPQGSPGGTGMPSHLLVEGANRADFSDARKLLETRHASLFDVTPIMMWNFPETRCRYVRFTALGHRLDKTIKETLPRIGFAEVEILSKGANVAAGKSVLAKDIPVHERRPRINLTDTRNAYGEILSIRKWLNELARRHELEGELPRVNAALSKRYAAQKANLRRISVLTIVLASGIVIVILIMRAVRTRQMYEIKERFAADLHDELGAKVQSIGILSDLAQKTKNSPAELDPILENIRNSTKDLGSAMRHCTNLLEADTLYTNLHADMHRTAKRLLLDYEITIEGEEHIAQLDKQTQIDLLLFYKECLVNISRHAEATHFSADLVAIPKSVTLTVSDNGQGFTGGTPPSLKRRARIIKATVSSAPVPGGGSCILLSLPVRKQTKKHP